MRKGHLLTSFSNVMAYGGQVCKGIDANRLLTGIVYDQGGEKNAEVDLHIVFDYPCSYFSSRKGIGAISRVEDHCALIMQQTKMGRKLSYKLHKNTEL